MLENLKSAKALTFDLFGTVLDLQGSLTPPLTVLLREAGCRETPQAFWQQLRHRQRIEQYQDSLLQLGHSGYLETVEKAFHYVCRLNGWNPTGREVAAWMEAWKELTPFPEVRDGLQRLRQRYRLIAFSNGNPWFLEHLTRNRIRFEFDAVISVESAGAFKPHPGTYRRTARELNLEVSQLIMISSNSFDVMGSRACGLNAVWVDRYGLPYEQTVDLYQPDLIVHDFTGLADALLAEDPGQ
ncbi:MAG: haloacid dehalogenase type II [Opitutales bacterium]